MKRLTWMDHLQDNGTAKRFTEVSQHREDPVRVMSSWPDLSASQEEIPTEEHGTACHKIWMVLKLIFSNFDVCGTLSKFSFSFLSKCGEDVVSWDNDEEEKRKGKGRRRGGGENGTVCWSFSWSKVYCREIGVLSGHSHSTVRQQYKWRRR